MSISNLIGQTNSQFPGEPLPALTHGDWIRRTQTWCLNCPKSISEHCSWMGNGPAIDTETRRAASLEQAAMVDQVIDRRMEEQAWIHRMHRWKHGIYYYYNTDKETRIAVGWEVVSMAGAIVTCRYKSGDSNPSRMQIGGSYYRLPAGGVAMFTNTIGAARRRYVVKRIICSETIAEDETFQIELDNATGDADTLFPSTNEDPIVLTYQFYGIYLEGFIQPRRTLPLTVKAKAIELFSNDPVSLLDDQLLPCRVLAPEMSGSSIIVGGGIILVCGVLPSGVRVDVTTQCSLQISHASGGYESILTLPETYDHYEISYYFASTADDAIWMGSDRCKWSYEDPSWSWGQTDGTLKYYCANPAASGRGDFKPECYQAGVCDGWEPGGPTNPFSASLLLQLQIGAGGGPWIEYAPAAGVSRTEVELIGPPSLGTLAGLDLAVPGGYHAPLNHPQNGGWGKAVETSDGLFEVKGVEVLAENRAAAAEWPLGPGAPTEERGAEMGGVLGDENDPDRVHRAPVMSAGVSLHPYSLGYINGIGWRTRVGRQYHALIPALDVDLDVATEAIERIDASIERGMFTIGETAWGAKITFAPARLDKALAVPDRGLVRSVQIYKGVSQADGLICLDLIHGLEMGGAFSEACKEVIGIWSQGGLNVEVAEWKKNRNWLSRFRVGVDETKIKPGMTIEVSGLAAPNRFVIERAEGMVGENQTIVPNGALGKMRSPLPGAFFVEFDSSSETIFDGNGDVHILVSRDSGGTTLTRDVAGPPRPYSTSGLAQDHYFVEEGTNLDQYGNTLSGCWFFYSHLNSRSADAMSYMQVVELKTYNSSGAQVKDYGSYSLVHDLYTGSAMTTWQLPGSELVSELTGIKIRTRKIEDGAPVEIPLTIVYAEPSDEGYIGPSVDECYVWSNSGMPDFEGTVVLSNLIFATNPYWANEAAVVDYTAVTNDCSEETWIADNVTPMGERPNGSMAADYETFYKKSDRIWIRDENGRLAAWRPNVADWEGTTQEITAAACGLRSGGAMTPTITIGSRGMAAESEEVELVEGTDYLYFGAAGEIYLSPGIVDVLYAQACLIMKLWLCDRTGRPLEADETAIEMALDRIRQQGIWCGTPTPLPAIDQWPTGEYNYCDTHNYNAVYECWDWEVEV